MFRVARFITAAAATLPVAALTIAAAGVFSGAWLSGVALAAAGIGVPMLIMAGAIRTGYIADRFISSRWKRAALSAPTAFCLAIAACLGAVLAAPGTLVRVVIGVGACVVAVGLTSMLWKISAHTTISGFVAGVLMFTAPGWGLFALALPAAVGWARVALNAHTVAQASLGALLGCLIGVLTFSLR